MNISTVINIKILTNSNQQTQSYEFTSHIAVFLSVVLITEMLETCIQTSYDQNFQLVLKSYIPVVYGTPLSLRGIVLVVICDNSDDFYCGYSDGVVFFFFFLLDIGYMVFLLYFILFKKIFSQNQYK